MVIVDVRLSWVVGILATVTLMLTVLLFVVITCRFYKCNRNHKGAVQLNSSAPETTKRYSEDPTKVTSTQLHIYSPSRA